MKPINEPIAGPTKGLFWINFQEAGEVDQGKENISQLGFNFCLAVGTARCSFCFGLSKRLLQLCHFFRDLVENLSESRRIMRPIESDPSRPGLCLIGSQ